MTTLTLKSGKSVTMVAVAGGRSLGKLVSAQLAALGRNDREDPFYLVDLGRLLDLCDLWRERLPGVHPFYAVKCNSDPALLHMLAALGCGFDCASKAEIKAVLDLGVSPERIIYANPCKQVSHLRYACKRGVATMTFDNEVELHKVKENFPSARLVLRIRADDPSALCQLGVKFGCSMEEGRKLVMCAREMGLCMVGVSFHVGSNSKNPHVFHKALEMAQQMFDFAESLGYHLTILDIGGGFPGTSDSTGFFTHLTDVLKEGLGQYFSGRADLNIIAEPGRYFACSTHTLAVNIISKRAITTTTSQATPTFMYFVNDGVYGSFNCILYDHIVPTPLVVEPPSVGSAVHQSSLWGPTCDGLDKICDFSLPELQVGDWLYFKDMGAYTLCAASDFNGFTKPEIHYIMSEDVRFVQVWNNGLDSTEHFSLSLPHPSPRHTVTPSPPQDEESPSSLDYHGNSPVTQEMVPVF